MSSQFKKGDTVEQVHPVVKGQVTGFVLCQETGEVHPIVSYVDEAGNVHEKQFHPDQLKAVG